MGLHLTDEQAQLLAAELDRIIAGESPRIAALREIRALLKPYPERSLAPAPQASSGR